eukprot:5113005-Pyramimonas_sp.AAC.1
MVSHAELLCAARDTAFPLAPLRPLCALCRGPRRAMHQQSVSHVIHANGSIIARCYGATGLAKLMAIATLR